MTLPLTTLSAVKEALAITNTQSDSYLTNLITRVSQYFETFCGRGDLTQSLQTEGYDATGQRDIILRRWPVASVASVTIDGVLFDPTTYKLIRQGRNGLLRKLGTARTGRITFPWGQDVWPLGGDTERIQIAYTAGYAATPADVEQSAIEQIAIWFRRRQWGLTATAESLGEYSYSRPGYLQNILGSVIDIWMLYKEFNI